MSSPKHDLLQEKKHSQFRVFCLSAFSTILLLSSEIERLVRVRGTL